MTRPPQRRSAVQTILNWPRPFKRFVALGVDALIAAGTVYLAYYLRLGVWPAINHEIARTMGVAVALAVPIFITLGLYRAIFRYAGGPAMLSILRAALLYGLVFATIFTLIGVPGTPRTVGLIQPILLFALVGSSRLAARTLFEERYTALWRSKPCERVLIYGAGRAGRELAGTIVHSPEMELVGFIDDDPEIAGASLAGQRIHPGERIVDVIERYSVEGVLLAIPSSSTQRRSEIIEKLEGIGVHVRTLPSMSDIARGKISVSDLKELDIVDLLGRPPVTPDQALLDNLIRGGTILVTGAGGSIGSELCRQVVEARPRTLILVEQSEYNLYTIERELRAGNAGAGDDAVQILAILASVRDGHRMGQIFASYGVTVVLHAAAYKHVPLVEQNLAEGIANNVLGTMVVARLAIEHQVPRFILISTDKAVRPTNAMGASKRCAEMIVQALDQEAPATRFAMVRFGNVLGSSGSVVPLFREQVAAGGPVTLTHRDITRYFMSISEAAQLVLQAGAMAAGGEVFVLDMGEPVRIYDLATAVIRLSGRTVRDADRPDGDIEIRIEGLRPGEKLYEELLIGGETIATQHPRIRRAREHSLSLAELTPLLGALEQSFAAAGQGEKVRHALQAIVREYTPNSPVVDALEVGTPQASAS